MRRILAASIVAVIAVTPLPGARAGARSSRVIVSATLNSTLQFFDAASLSETQPPLPSRGLAPVRLWIQGTHLLVANHGVEGSLGVFDLSDDVVLEAPLSPVPARAGSVGVSASGARAYVTNTWHALGGCGMPAGSVTAYDTSQLDTLGAVVELSTTDTSGSIPYGVAAGGGEIAYVTNSCANTLDTFVGGVLVASRATGAGPDGVLADGVLADGDRIYVANIDGSSLSVFDPGSPAALTTVSLPGAHPIDLAFAGSAWILSSNGGDDTVSVLDRARVEQCIVGAIVFCNAEIARIPTGVLAGAPEGVAFDPVSSRVFVVNKNIASPSLSVIQLGADGHGVAIARIPLTVAGTGTPPALIAFDVVVQTR